MKIPNVIDNVSRTLKDLRPPHSENNRSTTNYDVTASDKTTENNDDDFPHYKRVADYLLGTCIGEGSFAKVRVGLHKPTKEKVAVKIINKAKAKRDSYVFKNLHREGKIMQTIRHPNVIQVYDILETGNNYYLVTELCSGGELIDIVTKQGCLAENTVRKYVFQLVNAVAYLHKQGIVHRDLKVENLLLDSENNLKIIDLGLSNTLPLVCSDISRCLATQCGSPAYAAPELLSKRMYGPKVDVWSIGVITYALLVGKLPFTVDPFHISKLCKKMLRGEMNPIPTQVTSSCRHFIRKLLSPDHKSRPFIDEVAKLIWITSYESESRRALAGKKSMSALLIDRITRDGSFRTRHSSTSHNSLIDSIVVKEMKTTFNFAYSDVMRCVQKNQPGRELATYYLLVQKKRSINGKKKDNSFISEAIQEHNEGKLNKKQLGLAPLKRNDVLATHKNATQKTNSDYESVPILSVDLLLTPPLSNIRTTKGFDASQKDNKTTGIEAVKAIKNDLQKNSKAPFSKYDVTTTTLLQQNPSKTHHTRHGAGSANELLCKPSCTKHSISPPTVILAKNAVNQLDELPASMLKINPSLRREDKAKTRENVKTHGHGRVVLAVKREDHIRLEKPTEHLQISLPSPVPAPSPQLDSELLPVQKLKPMFYEARSNLEQDAHAQHSTSPHLTFTRGSHSLSHHNSSSRNHNNFYLQSPYMPISLKSSCSTDGMKANNVKESGMNMSSFTSSHKHPRAPDTLPAIVSKGSAGTKQFLEGSLCSVRRSLTTSPIYCDTTNRLILTPGFHSQPDPVKNVTKQNMYTKSPISSKVQKPGDNVQELHLFATKSPHSYYVTKSNGYSDDVANRPRKVVSDPIKVAVSYLNHTKHTTF